MASRDVRAVHARVTGQVQGVGFRAYAAQRAGEHGVTGWVRNESDGSVSAGVEGPDAAVSALLDDLRAGPRSAVVDDVEVREVDPEGWEGFRVT